MTTHKYILNTLLIICILLSYSTTNAQQKEKKYKSFNQILKEAEYINKVYIPYDLEDAMRDLDSSFSEEDKTLLKEAPLYDFFTDEDAMRPFYKYKINHDWRLNKSRLGEYFRKRGIDNVEGEMIPIVYTAFQLRTKGEKFDLDKYLLERKKLKKERITLRDWWRNKRAYANHNFCIGVKVYFLYRYGFSSDNELDAFLEARALNNKKELKNIVATGIILDINYSNDTYLVKVIKTFSPKGIIVFDPMEDFDYVSVNNHDNCIFLKEGDKMWFNGAPNQWLTE